jgi:hypothetical protein
MIWAGGALAAAALVCLAILAVGAIGWCVFDARSKGARPLWHHRAVKPPKCPPCRGRGNALPEISAGEAARIREQLLREGLDPDEVWAGPGRTLIDGTTAADCELRPMDPEPVEPGEEAGP